MTSEKKSQALTTVVYQSSRPCYQIPSDTSTIEVILVDVSSDIVQHFEKSLSQHANIEINQTLLLVKIWVLRYRDERKISSS